ncbi:MAG: methyltransferase domain-containing protein [Myxococcales bacterium]|nr:methyltransferase domain-containing protein [Myxococcales bacterium]
MREKLLEILVEPVTGSPLTLRAAEGAGGDISGGELLSESSGRTYPIVRGIPRFVPVENYAASFGKQWNKFRKEQLDSAVGATASQVRFDAEAGWTSADLSGKWLLDAGCGAGRFSEVVAARGPNLVSMDLSSAVDATRETLCRFNNVDVVQASIFEPPFRPGTFDFAYCIGVLQHTPDPPRATGSVVQLVRPGGRFALTIYARQPWTKLNAKYLARRLTRHISSDTLLSAIELAMPVLFPATDMLFRLPMLGKVAQFTIPVANYVGRKDITRAQRYQETVLDTFDMLAPTFDLPMTDREVDGVLSALGAQSWDFRTRVPINCVGVR